MTDEDLKRTQDEILERIEYCRGEDSRSEPRDWLGCKREVLVDFLDYEHAKPYLNEGVTAEQWAAYQSQETLKEQASGYYEFALGKIENHRGLNALRSVDKLETYAWLLGRDDIVEAMSKAPHAQYGAPKVKVFADMMGLEWPTDEFYTRMANGQECEDGCSMGCEL